MKRSQIAAFWIVANCGFLSCFEKSQIAGIYSVSFQRREKVGFAGVFHFLLVSSGIRGIGRFPVRVRACERARAGAEPGANIGSDIRVFVLTRV